MKIINRSILSEFWQSHHEGIDSLKAWLLDVTQENWDTQSDILLSFPKAQFFNPDGICFEITPSCAPTDREISPKKAPYFLLASVKYSAHILLIQGVELSPPAFLSTTTPFTENYHVPSSNSK